jgi:hypothetical protein
MAVNWMDVGLQEISDLRAERRIGDPVGPKVKGGDA